MSWSQNQNDRKPRNNYCVKIEGSPNTQLKLLYSGYANIYTLINFLKLIT